MLRILIVMSFFLFNSVLYASFDQGKQLFNQKCASCHKEYVSFKKLKENFFERKNQLLNITVPTQNMLAWAIMDSSKKIGDPQDEEMRQIEIEEYLKNYLEDPDMNNSICDESVKKYYIKKEPMKITDEEAALLAQYFMGYKKDRLKNVSQPIEILSKNYDEKKLLKEAADQGKHFMVYATSKSCHFCKKMDKNVLGLKEVQDAMNEAYMFVKVDVDTVALPFKLKKHFKGMTPTFFVLTPEGKLLNTYPGSWNKSDFLEILKENL